MFGNSEQWEREGRNREQRTVGSCVLYPGPGLQHSAVNSLGVLYCVRRAAGAASWWRVSAPGSCSQLHYPLLVYCPLIVHQWAGPPAAGPALRSLRLRELRPR